MKKEITKYKVTQNLTEQEIKAIGMNRYLQKYRWIWLLGMGIVWVVALAVIKNISNIEGAAKYLIGVAVIMPLLVFEYKWLMSGKKFWNKIKDKPQPFDLD